MEIKHLTHDLIGFQGDPDKNARYKSGALDIIIDTDFNKFATEHVTQDGIVAVLPDNPKQKNIDIKVGDHCYVHHFVFKDNHIVSEYNGEPLYITEYKNCFCKIVEGSIEMLGDWNLVEIHQDGWDSDVIINPDKKNIETYATAKYLSESAKELGVEQGDRVYFHQRCAYELKVEGTIYFRVETKHFEAITKEKDLD